MTNLKLERAAEASRNVASSVQERSTRVFDRIKDAAKEQFGSLRRRENKETIRIAEAVKTAENETQEQENRSKLSLKQHLAIAFSSATLSSIIVGGLSSITKNTVVASLIINGTSSFRYPGILQHYPAQYGTSTVLPIFGTPSVEAVLAQAALTFVIVAASTFASTKVAAWLAHKGEKKDAG